MSILGLCFLFFLIFVCLCVVQQIEYNVTSLRHLQQMFVSNAATWKRWFYRPSVYYFMLM